LTNCYVGELIDLNVNLAISPNSPNSQKRKILEVRNFGRYKSLYASVYAAAADELPWNFVTAVGLTI